MIERKTFEIGVYNKDVRDLVEVHEHHAELSDNWADIHWFDIKAHDEDEARSIIEQRYPPWRGYVITEVITQEWE